METISKVCFKCGQEKPLSDYYKHPQTVDGHFNKCKACSKKDTKVRADEKMKDPSFVESERKRHRDKYHKLNYKDAHKPAAEQKKEIMRRYAERFPEMILARSSANKLPKLEKGMERHHWSYNEEHYKDVIILDIASHNTLHRFIKYDQSHLMYRDSEGNLLDTRLKHEAYAAKVLAL